jgi:hypothetical protein
VAETDDDADEKTVLQPLRFKLDFESIVDSPECESPSPSLSPSTSSWSSSPISSPVTTYCDLMTNSVSEDCMQISHEWHPFLIENK